jgi:hypothetical protein
MNELSSEFSGARSALATSTGDPGFVTAGAGTGSSIGTGNDGWAAAVPAVSAVKPNTPMAAAANPTPAVARASIRRNSAVVITLVFKGTPYRCRHLS